MIPFKIQVHFKWLFNLPVVKEAFKNISIEDKLPKEKAKNQEKFIINNSNNLLFTKNTGNDYNSKDDLNLGDFQDHYGNFYDLKVGKSNLAGSITYKSIKYFGNTSYSTHWYLCTNISLTKFYIIDARVLYEYTKKTSKRFLSMSDKELEANWYGENDYKRYSFTMEVDLND